MAGQQVEIDVFRDRDDEEVVAYGRIRPPSGTALENEIEVLLVPTRVGPAEDLTSDVRTVWLPFGQLDLVRIGSRWRDGSRIGLTGDLSFHATCRLAGAEPLHPPQPDHVVARQGVGGEAAADRPRTTSSSSIRGVPCFKLVDPEAAKRPGSPRILLLPQIELLKALFGVSNRFLLQMSDGIRGLSIPGRGLLDRGKSIPRSDGTVVLHCHVKPTRDEALIMAAIVADRRIKRLHDGLFQALAVSDQYRSGPGAWPKVEWPFGKPVRLGFDGRWFNRGEERRFLIVRLTSIDLGLNFHSIEVHHPAGSGPEDGRPPSTARVRHGRPVIAVLTSGRPPSSARSPVKIASGSVAMAGSAGIRITFDKSISMVAPKAGAIGEERRERGDSSTAGSQPGGDARVSPSTTSRDASDDGSVYQRQRSDALRLTWSALLEVRKKKGWRLEPYMSLGPGDALLPDGGMDFRTKDPLVIKVTVPGSGQVLVVDDGTVGGHRKSLGIVVPDMRHDVFKTVVDRIFKMNVVLGGRWGRRKLSLEDCSVKAVRRHVATQSSVGQYADLLISGIEAALRGG